MTNETEALRISGNVTVPKDVKDVFSKGILELISENSLSSTVVIVPQDDPSGMRLYRVEEVEGLKKQIALWEKYHDDATRKEEANDKLTLSLSEELAQTRKAFVNQHSENNFLKGLVDERNDTNWNLGLQIQRDADKIQALEKRLELSENNRWRTFIKWWKETF